MSQLHILVGIPACGKSTWARASRDSRKDYPELPEIHIVSTDQIREDLTGDATEQGMNDLVFATLHDRVKLLLRCGFDVIVDATNLKDTSRNELRKISKELMVSRFAHRFGISEDYATCQDRNLARERVVPEDVMERFYQNFLDNCTEKQLTSEGWNVVEEG